MENMKIRGLLEKEKNTRIEKYENTGETREGEKYENRKIRKYGGD